MAFQVAKLAINRELRLFPSNVPTIKRKTKIPCKLYNRAELLSLVGYLKYRLHAYKIVVHLQSSTYVYMYLQPLNNGVSVTFLSVEYITPKAFDLRTTFSKQNLLPSKILVSSHENKAYGWAPRSAPE